MFHNCGHILPFLEDMVDFGVQIAEPFECSNDILGTKEKYKGKLTLTNNLNSLHLLFLIYTTGTVRRITCAKFTGTNRSQEQVFPFPYYSGRALQVCHFTCDWGAVVFPWVAIYCHCRCQVLMEL